MQIHHRSLLAAFMLVLSFTLYRSYANSPRPFVLVDKIILASSSRLQSAAMHLLRQVGTYWQHLVYFGEVREALNQCQHELFAARNQLQKAHEEHFQAQQLRQMVGISAQYPQTHFVYAEVIATSPTELFHSLRINRGTRDGLRLGAAVLTADGLVGRIASVTQAFADIMLLYDNNSSVDVLLQRTRTRARARGLGEAADYRLEVELLSRTFDVNPGDLVVTGGLSPLFPKGIPIGMVVYTEQKAFGLYRRALLQPKVDFSRVEAVWVVTPAPTHD